MKTNITERDNFAYLTIALVVFLLLASVLHQFLASDIGARLMEGAMVLMLAAGVWSIRTRSYVFRTGLGLTVGILVISLAGYVLDATGLSWAHDFLLLGFFVLATWAAVKQVLFSGRVDGNAIVGAICVYLLLGMIWAMLYVLLEKAAPGAFKGLAETGGTGNFMELVYFSFVSLTTMGYGDITPVLPLVRYFAFMEGIVGQFYIAILVASLVGVQVCNELKERYPDQVDGIERMAMVYEARGENQKATEYYLKTAEFMRSNPGFDKEGIEWASGLRFLIWMAFLTAA